MTDRRSAPGPGREVDAEFERLVRTAFGAAAAPGAPEGLQAEVSRLVDTPEVRVRGLVGGRMSFAVGVVVVGLFVVLVGSLLSIGSGPSPSASSGTSASVGPVPSPSGTAAGSCDVSQVTVRGTWWREIGGPNAFFNWEGGPLPAGTAPWKLIVRFDPDMAIIDSLWVWAERLDTEERVAAAFNSRLDPSTIYRFDDPAPDLPGGWYLFEQPLPTPGCWRLSAAIDGQVVGTATVEVTSEGLPTPTPGPSSAPTPDVQQTPWPAESMAPAADNRLPLAGRDGLPGWLTCGHHPFLFDGLGAPTGAEDRIGPEFDVLRETVAKDGANFWAEGGPDPTFREAGRDASGVVFLYDRVGVDTTDGGPYIYIEVASDGTDWRWEGSGDCLPRALPPLGYGQALWTLDPDFKAPDKATRTLHILVEEWACSSGRSASGRISPAFVTWDLQQVAVEVFVEVLAGDQDCQKSPPTPATVRLPIVLGDRTLFDTGTWRDQAKGG